MCSWPPSRENTASASSTLARYLFSRSPLAGGSFQRRDAREWLVTDADPATLAGFTYLDRVDLLAPPGQGLLLSVLKSLQDRPPGRSVLLASSQTSLRQMAAQGLMLPDLAFRLTAVRFAIPPLRQRREDIAPLAQALLDRICTRYQQRPVLMAPGTLARLLQHNWPGNVRELASVLETALLEAVNGIIRPDDLALPSGLEAPSDLRPGRPHRQPQSGRRHSTSRAIRPGPEPRQQAARRPPTGHQPLHPLPHLGQRGHPGALRATLSLKGIQQHRPGRATAILPENHRSQRQRPQRSQRPIRSWDTICRSPGTPS